MILTCPACTTRYFADDSAIGQTGRNVRCAACGHSWFVEGQLLLEQTAPDDLLPTPRSAVRAPLSRAQVERMRQAEEASSPAARIRARESERRRRERVRATAMAWGGAGATLAASAGAAVAFHEDVAKAWPQAASAYAALGLHVNVYGLEFGELEIERDYDGPTPVLIVSGTVRNLTGEPKGAPTLRFGLRDAAEAEVYAWMVGLEGEVVAPGASAHFRTVLDNPPLEAEELEATFASEVEVASALLPMLPLSRTSFDDLKGLPQEAQTPFDETPAPVDAAEEPAAPLASGEAEATPALIRAGPVDRHSGIDGVVTLAALRR